MKSSKLKILLIITVLLMAGCPVFASQVMDPTDIGVGARPLGMGKAYTAIADDCSALFTNPAGLAQKKNIKVLSMWGNLMAEVPYTVFGVSAPMWGGSIGLGYAGLQVGGIQEAVLVGGVPELTGNEGSFNNSSINIAYAADAANIPVFSNMKVLASSKLGLSVKMVRQDFSGSASFEAGKISGIDMDLGLLSKVNDDTNFGLSIKNLIPGNNIGKDELPMSINAGISKYFSKWNLLTDLDMDMEMNRGLLLRAGCEWNPVAPVKIRLGLDQKPNAGSSITNLAAGVGLMFKMFSFDYAYHTFAGLPELSTHFFSIGITWDEQKADQVKEKVLQPLVQPKPAEKQTIKPKVIPAKKTPAKKTVKKKTSPSKPAKPVSGKL
ncbi:MAG: hypothetical protein WC527_08085 [Candidatus Margulisiibacteriota bacterium]